MPKTATVTVRMDQKLKDRLMRAAKASNRSVSELLTDGAKKQIEYEKWFRKKVQEGLQSIKDGKTLTSGEVLARIEKRHLEQKARSRPAKLAAE